MIGDENFQITHDWELCFEHPTRLLHTLFPSMSQLVKNCSDSFWCLHTATNTSSITDFHEKSKHAFSSSFGIGHLLWKYFEKATTQLEGLKLWFYTWFKFSYNLHITYVPPMDHCVYLTIKHQLDKFRIKEAEGTPWRVIRTSS